MDLYHFWTYRKTPHAGRRATRDASQYRRLKPCKRTHLPRRVTAWRDFRLTFALCSP